MLGCWSGGGGGGRLKMEEGEKRELVEGKGDSFWGYGRSRYGGEEVEAPAKRSSRALGKEEEEGGWKGGAGIPVNSWTMARKLVASVVRTVVGARLEARVRFLGLRTVAVLLLLLL